MLGALTEGELTSGSVLIQLLRCFRFSSSRGAYIRDYNNNNNINNNNNNNNNNADSVSISVSLMAL